MVDPWAVEEMRNVRLADKRLNTRVMEILSLCGAQPTASIPAACGGYAETTAAYRLFDNPKVGWDNVLEPHVEATRRRMADQEKVIVVQDTTELDLTRPQQQVVGAGPLDGGSRRGVFLHLSAGFTPDGTPLGTVQGKVWARPDGLPPKKVERSALRKQTPIEDKESYRWIEGLRQVRIEAQRAPQTHFIAVADSEGDIYELLVEAGDRPANMEWIVRACQDRALIEGHGNPELSDSHIHRVRQQVLSQEVLFTHTIHVRGREAKVHCEERARRQPRQSRTAEVEVRAAPVTLRPPWRPDRKLPEVTVHAVVVREIHPPPDEPPVEWVLLTSLPIDTVEQVRQMIQTYCVRWMIEILFRTLKSGCAIEDRRFEHVHRFLPCLAVYVIVAWRALYVCRIARAFPDISCEAIFEPAEWKAVYHVVRRQPPPTKPPNLSVMVAMVAQLGGYVDRKRPDPPGPQTVWLGLQRAHDMALCWLAFGPEAKT